MSVLEFLDVSVPGVLVPGVHVPGKSAASQPTPACTSYGL